MRQKDACFGVRPGLGVEHQCSAVSGKGQAVQGSALACFEVQNQPVYHLAVVNGSTRLADHLQQQTGQASCLLERCHQGCLPVRLPYKPGSLSAGKLSPGP